MNSINEVNIPLDSPHPSLRVDRISNTLDDPNSIVYKPILLYKGPLVVKWLKEHLEESEPPIIWSEESVNQFVKGYKVYGEIALFLYPAPFLAWQYRRPLQYGQLPYVHALPVNTTPVFALPVNASSYLETRIPQRSKQDRSYGNLISTTMTTMRIGVLSSVEIGEATTPLDEIKFYLVNFQIIYLIDSVNRRDKIDRMARLQLKFNGWILDIERRLDFVQTLHYLEEKRGYTITHNCRLRRVNSDGTSGTFTFQDTESVLNATQLFASFVRGGMVGVALPVGYKDGNTIYEKWDITPADPGRYPDHGSSHIFPGWYLWFDAQSPKWLPHIFSQFAMKWWHSDKEMQAVYRDALSNVILSYTDAERADPSRGIVPAFIALETLGWFILVVMEKKLTKTEYKNNLNATERIRKLLCWANIGAEIPTALINLSEKAGVCGWDGPQAVTKIRNLVVHPEKREQLVSCITTETCNLAMWYVELVTLKMLDYKGDYRDRLDNKRPKRVPWADNIL